MFRFAPSRFPCVVLFVLCVRPPADYYIACRTRAGDLCAIRCMLGKTIIYIRTTPGTIRLKQHLMCSFMPSPIILNSRIITSICFKKRQKN